SDMPTFYDLSVKSPSRALTFVPGIGLTLLITFVGFAVHDRFDAVSPLVASLAIGVALGNLGAVPAVCAPGVKFSAKKILRLGIMLLGSQLAVSQVVELGGAELAVVIVVVAATFLGTMWLGPRLGVSRPLSLLVATGFSICGASAVAAMEGVAEADEEEVTYAIALVTLCGSLAIILLPALRNVVGLDAAEMFGAWVGASVHDVAQVIATSSTGGDSAVQSATVVKLSRVVLLAPLVAMVSVWLRTPRAGLTSKSTSSKVSVVPIFVVGFIAMILVRTTGVLSDDVLSTLKTIEQWCLASALVGLGAEVRLSKLLRVGGRPLALAGISWGAIATLSLVGVHLVN
ncbi:MAG: YeiH family protein, partial [Actinomycetota bacterium]